MSNSLTPVPTISLLEPPTQTIANSVTLSPPKTTCVSASDELLDTEPRASVSSGGLARLPACPMASGPLKQKAIWTPQKVWQRSKEELLL
ncbi:hypothetical protein AVEN_23846-1 [Araneus ventricosus]|uniref:Uncharacterized protein n=1 Tax=Araneus ventricosus TaxID=182803 RepID=A0A4Y2PSW3_ARAVE|nr:hypothetical protein AVEN_23846-1 [Araneus ventricosus]